MLKTKLSKVALTLAAGGLLTMASAFAADNGNCNDNCCAKNCCTKQGGGYCKDNCCGEQAFYTYGELLYWTICQSNLDYAVTGDTEDQTEDSIDVFRKGKIRELSYDWDLGFRVGVGYRTCERWDIGAEFTHFTGHADGHASDADPGDTNHVMYTILVHPDIGDNAHHAKGELDTDYNVFDLTIRHPFCVCKDFELQPLVGLRALWLEQDYDLHLWNEVEEDGADFPGENDGVYWDSKYVGIGARGGLEMIYRTCNNWSIYARTAGSVLVGQSEATEKQIRDDDLDLYVKEKDHCEPVFGCEAAVGINYEGCVCGYMWNASLGYEINYWANVPQIRRFNDVEGQGNSNSGSGSHMALHGATLRLGMTF